jgi:hypothetical protein
MSAYGVGHAGSSAAARGRRYVLVTVGATDVQSSAAVDME